MNLHLDGKKAVVTGASMGIGYAVAKELMFEGAEVTICARDEERLKTAVKSLKKETGREAVTGYALDLSEEKASYELAELAAGESGQLDIWINNVGTNKARKGELYTQEELDYLVGACFGSALFGCQAAFLHMKENGGSIVNISSLAARAATCGRSNIYASMKAGIIALTKTSAGEYASYGIRVNAVMPGYTATPLVKSTFSGEALQELMLNNLTGRMAEPVEIAKPVVFLASEAASYINAAVLEVSGGQNVVLNPQYSFRR